MDMTQFVSSSKLDALVSSLCEIRRTNKDHKSIIFSQFVNFLDIIEW